MYTWLVELGFWSHRRSQHRDHDASLGSENCSAVNSIDETSLQLAVLLQSKFRIKSMTRILAWFRSRIFQRQPVAQHLPVHASLNLREYA